MFETLQRSAVVMPAGIQGGQSSLPTSFTSGFKNQWCNERRSFDVKSFHLRQNTLNTLFVRKSCGFKTSNAQVIAVKVLVSKGQMNTQGCWDAFKGRVIVLRVGVV